MVAKLALYLPTARAGERSYPISPSDLPEVFGRPGLLSLALSARNVLQVRSTGEDGATGVDPVEPRATDVMAHLRGIGGRRAGCPTRRIPLGRLHQRADRKSAACGHSMPPAPPRVREETHRPDESTRAAVCSA